MAAVTLTIDPDELRGLAALAALNGAADESPDADADAVGAARALLDAALSERLARAGLPWAPPDGAVPRQRAVPTPVPVAASAAAPAPGPTTAGTPSTPPRWPGRRPPLRRDLGYSLAVAVAVVLWGGYAKGWSWTGFQANGQLWDWISLLLLPAVIGVIPLWVQYHRYIGRNRRAAGAAVIVAWTGFVIAGYAVPIGWTGFRGQTLWDWIQLLLLPAVVAVTMALGTMHVHPARLLRSLRPYQKAVLAGLAAAWAVTVIGGYAAGWQWTGYPGNTLWDWLQLLLLPLVVPTVLLPALLNWITGDAAARAHPAPAWVRSRARRAGTPPSA